MTSSASLSEGTLAHRLGRGGGDETESRQNDVSAMEERYHKKGDYHFVHHDQLTFYVITVKSEDVMQSNGKASQLGRSL